MSDREAVRRELRELLYGGEELLEEVPVEGAVVGVTTHRVLALVPDGEPPFRAVHRPNVTGISVDAAGRTGDARRALRAGIYAAVPLAIGLTVDLGSLLSPVDATGTGATGLGGVVSLLNLLLGALGFLDEALLAVGVAAAAVAVLFAGRYLHSRERYLEIGVAGDEPVRLPVGRDRSGAAGRIEDAVEKASNASPA